MSDPRPPARRPALDPATVAPDPLDQFRVWFDEAGRAGVPDPTAMALATADAGGRPSVRMVLLKNAGAAGLTFFTNLLSRKGRELAANPRAALLFHWAACGRQVRVEGAVVPVPAAESDAYFATRPIGARVGAIASPQSEPVPDRAFLEARVRDVLRRHPHGAPPRPDHWGGLRLVPDAWEFWQEGEHRLHDRVRYLRAGDGWRIERLAP
uniref:Pyridoxamine 5'-phosphate oxidase n=1 Tax=Eiseniibacteriota bacterium TaxID=2212470 RepID=A0A832I1K6_UNCEI